VKAIHKYLKQWEWADVRDMRHNNKAVPKECPDDFRGRFVVISGATSGIGYLTAHKYASRGADLLLINRDEERSRRVCDEIADRHGVECGCRIADYRRLADVKRLGRELLALERRIDVLIHNAGVYATTRQLTADGHELVFQVNHLASFTLTYMLKERLKDQGRTRILYVNSEGHRFALSGLHLDDLRWDRRRYSGLVGYGTAKTAQLLTMLKFREYFQGSSVSIHAMHPGNVRTNLGENNGRLYRLFKHRIVNPSARDPQIAATALYYLGVSRDLEGMSGRFFNLTAEEKPAPHALDGEMAERIWNLSIELGGLE
jgi:retinol dehydrogenase 13